MEVGLEAESTLVHSPGAHYHSQATNSKNISSSSSSSGGESDVSDLVVENSSRFEGLNKQRKKSTDYRPQSASNSMSESESESASNSGSGSEKSAQFSQKKVSSNSRLSDEDSEATSSRSVSMTPVPGNRFKNSPLVRKSPLNVARRSGPSEVTAMRGYRYSMLPSRSAAANVSYSRYLEEADSDSDGTGFGRKRGRKQLSSDSEFEVGGKWEESASEDLSNSAEEFSDEYRPPKRKAKGRGQKDWGGSESDSDYHPGGGRRRGKGGTRKTVRRKNDGYLHSFASDGDSSASSSESEFEPGYVSKKRKKKKKSANHNADISPSDYVRTTGRSKGVVSYKNFYGSDEGSGDGEGEENGEGGVAEGEGAVVVEDNREAIEKILKKRIGRVGDTGNQTTCYAKCMEAGSDPSILSGVAQGDKECIARLNFTFDTPPPASGEPSEVQYLVKWLNWSYLHNTWETEASLGAKDIKGMKKFQNFLKREEEREAWEASASLEDIEYLKCQEELTDQLLVNFTLVERIIAAKNSDDGAGEKEYLCKWRGLPYSECTWEDASLISNWYQEEIDTYIERNSSDRIPNKNAKVLRHRPKFVFMKEQLRSLGGHNGLKLRDYQLEGVNWLVKSWCKSNSVILADEMGLGKTIQCIAFLHCLFHSHQLYGPYIVVVPLSTLPAWQREFELWAPEMNAVVYIGDVSSRNKIREHEWSHPNHKLKFNCILTTYEILLKDKEFLGSVAWTVLIVDEAHRLKNDDSLLYRTLMEFRTNYRLLVTGTPLQNSLKELWSLLHFIMEKKFPNWEDFEYDNQAYGDGDATCLTSIHQELQPFLLRRMKKDVEKSLPAKVEQILRVEMSSVQKQYYRWILSKNYKALSKGVKGSITGFINIMMELKKCCNHVWIVRSPDEKEEREKDQLQTLIHGSGKLYLLDKLLVRLSKTGHRVLIFSQMVRMLDVLADYMRLRHFHFQRLDGSICGDARKDAIDHFNAEGSQDFCFLLSTRAGGLGVNLATADTVVIFDSDWNPQNDLQAQARAHRIGQKKQVNIYRLVTKNSVEEDIIERAKKKMVLDHLVIQRMDTTGRTILSANKEPSKSVPFDKDELNAILKFGAEELFKDGEASGDKALQEMDIDDILQRAEMQATAEDSSHSDLLSQFKVASFAMDEELAPPPSATPTEGKTFLLSPRGRGHAPVERSWEELIPEDARKKVDEEERTREQLDLYLPPRQRTVRNYCEDQSQGNSKTRSGRSGAPPTKNSPEVCSTVVVKNIRGFTDAEIRRFVKSYRKFVNPKARLEAIAADAELQEKSMTELQRLMTVLHDGCVQAEEEHRASIETDPTYDPKKDKGASLRLCGVTIGSGNLLRREEELAALSCVLPANPAVRKKYRLLSGPKAVSWSGVKWTAVDDAKFLIGIYEHGLGNWESIRHDPNLGLANKILRPDTSLKPQASHLQTRAEYLLKLLQAEAAEKTRKASKSSSRSTKKPSLRAQTGTSSRSPAKKPAKNVPRSRIPKNSSSRLTVHVSRDLLDDSDSGTTNRRKGRATSAKSHLAKKQSHLTRDSQARSSPRRKDKVFIPGERTSPRKRKGRGDREKGGESSVKEREGGEDVNESSVELDEDTFKKCKTMMKPVRKAIGELKEPTEEQAERDPAAMAYFKKVLVEIGDHISSTLTKDKLEDSALWKTNLWIFVAEFTASGPLKLRKIYKKAKKMSGDATSSLPVAVKREHDAAVHSNSSESAPHSSNRSQAPPPLPRLPSGNEQPEAPSNSRPIEHPVNPMSGQHVYVASSTEGHGVERHRHPSGGMSDHSHSSETGHRYEEEFRHRDRERSHHHHHHHHRHGDRHRHSSGSSYHSDGGSSSSKRPRYHSPPPHHSGHSPTHRHNSHSHY